MATSLEKKVEVVDLMVAGQPRQEAVEQAEVEISASTAYRWVTCWREQGRAGLIDGRQGHRYKMTAEVRAWLQVYCQQAPHSRSSVVRKVIKERFELEVSRTHLNRVRAELGVSRPKKN